MRLPRIAIFADKLTVRYGRVLALNLPEFSLEGSLLALIGHNGSGKSTLIKAVVGLAPLSTGTLRLEFISEEGRRLLIPERDMAYSPEGGAVFSDVSVESYLKLWCRLKTSDPLSYRKAGSEIVERLGVSPLLKKLGRELSKGEKRRVQTAVGFLSVPKLFLMDEPFDGLDVVQANELGALIRDWQRKCCFIISSHRMDIVERLADQVLVLDHGRVAASGSVTTVIMSLAGAAPIAVNGNGHQAKPSLVDAMNFHINHSSKA